MEITESAETDAGPSLTVGPAARPDRRPQHSRRKRTLRSRAVFLDLPLRQTLQSPQPCQSLGRVVADDSTDTHKFAALLVREGRVVGVLGCQGKRETAVLSERMRSLLTTAADACGSCAQRDARAWAVLSEQRPPRSGTASRMVIAGDPENFHGSSESGRHDRTRFAAMPGRWGSEGSTLVLRFPMQAPRLRRRTVPSWRATSAGTTSAERRAFAHRTAPPTCCRRRSARRQARPKDPDSEQQPPHHERHRAHHGQSAGVQPHEPQKPPPQHQW